MNNYVILNSTDFCSYPMWIHLKIWWWRCYVHMNGFIMSDMDMNLFEGRTLKTYTSWHHKIDGTFHNLIQLVAVTTCAHCMWHDWCKTWPLHWLSVCSDIVHGITDGLQFKSSCHDCFEFWAKGYTCTFQSKHLRLPWTFMFQKQQHDLCYQKPFHHIPCNICIVSAAVSVQGLLN